MMNAEISLEELCAKARRAGLTLSDDELKKLLPGANRSHNQALDLRTLISDSVEPASTFSAAALPKT